MLFGVAYGMDWLRRDYPRLFEGENLRERLWLHELCCALRALIWWQPTRPSEDHPPVFTLRRLVKEPSTWRP